MTKRRQRRPPEDGEFTDPLKDYSPPDYADEVERAMHEDPVSIVGSGAFEAIKQDTTVREAVQIMAAHDAACLVIVDDHHTPIGVLSERDVLMKVAADYENLSAAHVSAVMTRDPVTVHDTDTCARVLNLMSTGGFRQAPVVDADDRLVGVAGVRSVSSYLNRFLSSDA